jgi:hypothetical protein
MGLTSFAFLKEAFAFAWDNRRAILGVALFPFCAILLHSLAFTLAPWFMLLNLLVLLVLVPFKIDLFRLLLLGEKPAGHYGQRLFRRRELKFFLYETGLTLFVCALLLVAWLIASRAGETWEGLGASLRLGSVVSVGLLLFLAFYYGVPPVLFFPSLSLGRDAPLKVLFAEARPFRARIFFTVFWVFAMFFLVAAVLPQFPAGAEGLGANPAFAFASALAESGITLAANIVVTLVIAVIFKRSLLPGPAPRTEDKDPPA